MRTSSPLRRIASAALLLALAACAQAPVKQAPPPPLPAPPATPAPVPAPPTGTPTAAEQAQFDVCIAGLRGSALAAGVGDAAFSRLTQGLVPDMSVLPLLDRQPEFSTPIWDYLAALVDDERVADGRAMLAKYAPVLAQVQDRYGVDPATVVAVWGVESDYGRNFGKRPLLQSLSTLSCFGRRQAYFRGEFQNVLQILERGDIAPGDLKGSWAGAFGHTQFMPSTFQRIAVDFDGDGRRDLVGSVPDALASTANYLVKSGWRSGQPWGREVRLPPAFDASLAGRTNRRPLSDWTGMGVAAIDGATINLPGDTRSALLLPAGKDGPAFVVFRNFDAIYAYNAAESYALAIAQLADRLRGGNGIVARWPTDDPGISRAQRKELQSLLIARGHAIGSADGAIGTATRRAIQVEQQRLGIAPADGRAGMRILEALRAGR